uniref:Uncharacterized protein n=1 Tax=Oryza nivara TaxID=4536 RepID=A0A0E0J2C6_ORYNI
MTPPPPLLCLSNPCEGRRLLVHRLQAINCGQYTGGDEESRGQAISLLPPTTLPALPTTTPTRATAEATHRAEEASQDTKAPSLRLV